MTLLIRSIFFLIAYLFLVAGNLSWITLLPVIAVVIMMISIKQFNTQHTNFYNYFCSQSCYNDFAHKYVQQVIAIAPRTEPLETPIEVTKEKVTSRWNQDHTYVETRITRVDNVQD